jgi:hypothetical protein
MKKIILAAIMLFSLNMGIQAQSVERKGNNFTQVSNKKEVSEKEVKPKYTYTDSKGNVYPIYLSSAGKAFIKKVSKKTGKEYKQYLPEIGKQINPSAYKENKK